MFSRTMAMIRNEPRSRPEPPISQRTKGIVELFSVFGTSEYDLARHENQQNHFRSNLQNEQGQPEKRDKDEGPQRVENVTIR